MTINTSDIQKNVIGLAIELTVKERNEITNAENIVDISSATVKKIILKNPNGIVSEKTASFVTNGTDGKIRYITVDGDINIRGKWLVQGYIESPNFLGNTTIVEFIVNDNLT